MSRSPSAGHFLASASATDGGIAEPEVAEIAGSVFTMLTWRLHKTRKIQALGQVLRDEIRRFGFDLPPGDSAAQLVADKAEEISRQLGVTTRTVLDSYMSEESMPELAKAISRQLKELTAVLDDAPPVAIDVCDGFMVVAAFGMCTGIALQNLHHPDAMIVCKDAGDSTVHVGVALATGGDFPVQIGGFTLSVARKVITMVLDLLQTEEWTCAEDHPRDAPCPMRQRLAIDLATLGGWAPNPAA